MGRHRATLAAKDSEGFRRFLRFLRGIDPYALAREVGVTREHIRHLEKGATGPSVHVAFAIQAATCGHVPAEAWTQPAKGKRAA